METPLDVLSRAATLIHDQLHGKLSSDDSKTLESSTAGGASGGGKELPSRTKKERRRHERHHDLLSTASRSRKERIEESDAPLDMSISGRRADPPPPPYHLHPSSLTYPSRYPSPPDYSSARPSVITCTQARSSPAPSCPSPCGSTSSRPPSSPPFRREIISSGMCDPVIDEHFRRSLGERYTHLFASSSSASPASSSGGEGSSSTTTKSQPSTVSVTGLSVDDHFAKALGETWLKLQNETKVDKETAGSPPAVPANTSSASTARPGLLLT